MRRGLSATAWARRASTVTGTGLPMRSRCVAPIWAVSFASIPRSERGIAPAMAHASMSTAECSKGLPSIPSSPDTSRRAIRVGRGQRSGGERRSPTENKSVRLLGRELLGRRPPAVAEGVPKRLPTEAERRPKRATNRLPMRWAGVDSNHRPTDYECDSPHDVRSSSVSDCSVCREFPD